MYSHGIFVRRADIFELVGRFENLAELTIGDEVMWSQQKGIIKFIGPLQRKRKRTGSTNTVHLESVWYGIELDEAVGHHDGVYQNVRYFECPEKHGIIVKAEQIKKSQLSSSPLSMPMSNPNSNTNSNTNSIGNGSNHHFNLNEKPNEDRKHSSNGYNVQPQLIDEDPISDMEGDEEDNGDFDDQPSAVHPALKNQSSAKCYS